MNGQEQVRRGGDVGAVRKREDVTGGPADGDRERDQRGLLQCVERDPERCRSANWFDPQLDQIGSVVRVARCRGVCVRAVGLREEVPFACRLRIARVSDVMRAVVVVQEVLVDELAAAIRGRSRYQDR